MLQFAAFLFTACTLAIITQRRIERVLPIGMGVLMLLLTALAIPLRLHWMQAVAVCAIAASAAALLVMLLRRRLSLCELVRRTGSYVLTPCFLCFAVLCAMCIWAAEPMTVWWRDDLGHWGLHVKSLWHFGGLVGAEKHLNPFFGTYMPGMSLWQWWVMYAMGEWHEGTLYAALFISYAIFLLPLFSSLKWRKAWLVPLVLLVLVVFPNWGNTVTYTTLSVDTALGLAFGYTLLCVYELRRGGRYAARTGYGEIALGMCSMILIKQIGLLLSVMALVLLFLLPSHDAKRRFPARMALCIAAPFALQLGWNAYCSAAGLSGFHTSNLSDHIAAMLNGTYVPPEGADGVAAALWQAFTQTYTGEMIFDTQAPVMLPKLLVCAALAAIPLLLHRFGAKEGKKTAAFAAAILVVYVLIQYVSFFTVFYHETNVYTHEFSGNMCLLMERYMAPLIIALAMLEVRMAVDLLPAVRNLRSGRLITAGVTVAAAAVLCLTSNWGVMRESLIPDNYLQHDRAYSVEEQARADHDYWATLLEGYEGAHVLVGLEPNSDFMKNLNYTYAPAHFEAPSADYAGSSESLAAYMLESGITHIVLFDDTHMLHAPASGLEEYGYLYPWSLYEVCPDGNGSLSLVEVY